jgi:hypothetical protein
MNNITQILRKVDAFDKTLKKEVDRLIKPMFDKPRFEILKPDCVSFDTFARISGRVWDNKDNIQYKFNIEYYKDGKAIISISKWDPTFIIRTGPLKSDTWEFVAQSLDKEHNFFDGELKDDTIKFVKNKFRALDRNAKKFKNTQNKSTIY